MPINIDTLTEAELRDLNHRIVERLRMFHQIRAHGAMLEFSLGDSVYFDADGRRISGVLTRYNRKTVTVIADGGHRWNVSPGLLRRAEPPRGSRRGGGDANMPPIVVDAVEHAPPGTPMLYPGGTR